MISDVKETNIINYELKIKYQKSSRVLGTKRQRKMQKVGKDAMS
jgi:hypothetical protein